MPLADSEAIAHLLDRPWSTVRWWIMKGWLERAGTSPEGRHLYDVQAAMELAARLSHQPLDKHPDQRQH